MNIFPKLTAIPDALRIRLEQMIKWFSLDRNQEDLQKYRYRAGIHKIRDEEGAVRCYFKVIDRVSAMVEASLYLLDHPSSGPRSESSDIYGFAGVLPTVCLQFTVGEGYVTGMLVEFAEDAVELHEHIKQKLPIDTGSLHKISLMDIRFGNADRSAFNIIVQAEGRFIPIDHEMCLCQDYNIASPCWLSLDAATEPFSLEARLYVEDLKVEEEIDFLKRCGWEDPPVKYMERLRISTLFLKKAMTTGLRLRDIGILASVKQPEFSLQSIVAKITEDEHFFENVGNEIDTVLAQYAMDNGIGG